MIDVIIYTCIICGLVFQTSSPLISCTVLHPPGQCCHYGETEISKDIEKKP